MENYELKIENILSKENIITDENKISLYDLYSIISKKLEKVRSIKIEDLVQKKDAYSCIFIRTNDTGIEILISIDCDTVFKVYKSINNNELVLSKTNDIITEFMKENYNKISYMFSVIEENLDFLQKLKQMDRNVKFNFDEFTYNIRISLPGTVKFYVDGTNISDDINSKNKFNNTIAKSKYELAKKQPVYIDSLDDTLKEVVIEYLDKENNNKKLIKR